MNRVRIVISYNGRWDQLPDGSQRFVGSENRGMYVSNNMTYEELVTIVQTIVNYDVNKYNVELSSISLVPGSTCRTLIRNDDDVQFMLGEDRVIPQVCVSLTERTSGDVGGNDIPPPENTQQFGSFSGSNQVFTQGGPSEGVGNMCGVPEVAVDHAHATEPQLGDVFGSRIEQYNEQYDVQYNEQYGLQYNEQYNDQYDAQHNEQYDAQYNQQNNYPNYEHVDNEANNEHGHDQQNVDEEPAQMQTSSRRVQGVSCNAANMPGPSEVRCNVTSSDSVNLRAWVIPGADSYSFGIGSARTENHDL